MKLGRPGGGGGGKKVKRGNWDRVVFNFPHVGGLTKDVNRQARANQGGFLRGLILDILLRLVSSELLVAFFNSALPLLALDGQIIMTVFEGEPYELWNVRDLARHAGFQVERSFKFQASAYPGYKHARTLGNIENGGGWKGEDRPARTYVFVSKTCSPKNEKKRKRSASDSEDE